MDGLNAMGEMLHYTACGLDNVFLRNGFKIHNTKYGEGVAIEDARGLHRVIANSIVTGAHPIRGQEVKFLRSMLELSQASLGRVLGFDRSTVARWEGEANNPLPDQSDRSLRMYFALQSEGNEVARELTALLQEEDENERKLFDQEQQMQLAWDEQNAIWARRAA